MLGTLVDHLVYGPNTDPLVDKYLWDMHQAFGVFLLLGQSFAISANWIKKTYSIKTYYFFYTTFIQDIILAFISFLPWQFTLWCVYSTRMLQKMFKNKTINIGNLLTFIYDITLIFIYLWISILWKVTIQYYIMVYIRVWVQHKIVAEKNLR